MAIGMPAYLVLLGWTVTVGIFMWRRGA